MARRANKPWYLRSRDGVAYVDYRVKGQRIKVSLGVPYHPERSSRAETRAAEEAAARCYSDHVAGRVRGGESRVSSNCTLEEAIALWLDGIENPTNKASVDTSEIYGRHWSAFFSDDAMRSNGHVRWNDGLTPFERLVSDAGPADYAAYRLTCVIRDTVRKELVGMFTFLSWIKLRTMIASVPPRPILPKGATGVRAGKQRLKPVHISEEQAFAIVQAFPEWSSRASRTDGKRFRVRLYAEFLWETGLRAGTVARLSVPKNFTRGSDHLELTNGDDKVRYGRTVPLSARGKAILDEVAPDEGLIFGKHDLRKYMKRAALPVLPPNAAKDFAARDFRHGRAIHLLETSCNLPGVAYLLGHKQLTTTNRYLAPQQRQGEAVMTMVDSASDSFRSQFGPSGGSLETGEVSEEKKKGPGHQVPRPIPVLSGRGDSNARPLDPQSWSLSAKHTKTPEKVELSSPSSVKHTPQNSAEICDSKLDSVPIRSQSTNDDSFVLEPGEESK